MADIELTCKECDNLFTFSEGEQSFFLEKFGQDYTQPKRCSNCRKIRREQRDQGGYDHRA